MTGRRGKLPAVMTVAGSDSGGGAGIQADLKTFEALGVFGTSAITCVTAQNPDAVAGIQSVDPDIVALQIRSICSYFDVRAAKTGMLYSRDIIRAVAAALDEFPVPRLVVDPVMVATSGARLLKSEAQDALCREILPRARVFTPNIPEAEALLGRSIVGTADAEDAARDLAARYGTACVVKGGHGDGDTVQDILFDEGERTVIASARIRGVSAHGTGCTFAAAITAGLAREMPLAQAVREAHEFVRVRLERLRGAGDGADGR